jgi:hypothetical protein
MLPGFGQLRNDAFLQQSGMALHDETNRNTTKTSLLSNSYTFEYHGTTKTMKQLYFLLLLFLLTGCAIPRGIHTPHGYAFSNKARFSLRGKCSTNGNTPISFSHLYIMSGEGWQSGLQFFADGRVAGIDLATPPRSMKTTGGFYCITGQELVIQLSHTVSLGMTGNEAGIIEIKGTIHGDTLFFTTDKWYGKGKNMRVFTGLQTSAGKALYYIKSTKAIPLATPDW